MGLNVETSMCLWDVDMSVLGQRCFTLSRMGSIARNRRKSRLSSFELRTWCMIYITSIDVLTSVTI